MTPQPRALDPEQDCAVLAELWADTLSPAWPVLPRALDRVRAGYVAQAAGEVVGAVVVDDAGCIPLLLVRGDHQRRGVGRRLVDAALGRLRAAGVTSVGLGSGNGAAYTWPGVPRNLPGAVAFFERTGWVFTEVTDDVVQDLRDFVAPKVVWDRARSLGLTVSVVPHPDGAAVAAFVDRHFPHWSRHFADPGAGDILAITTPADGVVAALIIEGPGSAEAIEPMLGADMGTIGCVGVAESHQGLGIGTAMVARASELLRARGVGTCHIGWTTRSSFYGWLGYRPWQSYLMARRALGSP